VSSNVGFTLGSNERKKEVSMSVNLVIFGRTYLFAEALARLLSDSVDYQILGIACDDDNMKTLLKKSNIDIIVTDHPECCSLLEDVPGKGHPKILLLSDNDKNPMLYDDLKEMISKGLAGIMPKLGDAQLLKKAILKLQNGEFWIDHKTIGSILTNFNQEQKKISLTKKEKEILKFVCSGESNKGIAEKLCISEQTVKSHCNHLFKKFGVPNRMKLAILATKYTSTSSNQNLSTNGQLQ
jgi:DNA-binding NarL/FixJ family response regulator